MQEEVEFVVVRQNMVKAFITYGSDANQGRSWYYAWKEILNEHMNYIDVFRKGQFY